jgi:hypothetical protein
MFVEKPLMISHNHERTPAGQICIVLVTPHSERKKSPIAPALFARAWVRAHRTNIVVGPPPTRRTRGTAAGDNGAAFFFEGANKIRPRHDSVLFSHTSNQKSFFQPLQWHAYKNERKLKHRQDDE